MKLTEIKHELEDPIGMVLIRQLMTKGVPVFWQDMGEIVELGWTPEQNAWNKQHEISVRFIESDGRSYLDFLSLEQFEAMDLERVPGSEIEEWRLV